MMHYVPFLNSKDLCSASHIGCWKTVVICSDCLSKSDFQWSEKKKKKKKETLGVLNWHWMYWAVDNKVCIFPTAAMQAYITWFYWLCSEKTCCTYYRRAPYSGRTLEVRGVLSGLLLQHQWTSIMGQVLICLVRCPLSRAQSSWSRDSRRSWRRAESDSRRTSHSHSHIFIWQHALHRAFNILKAMYWPARVTYVLQMMCHVWIWCALF